MPASIATFVRSSASNGSALRRFGIYRDETSKPYRYCWDKRANGISLPTLSTQECLLLSLAEQQLKQLLPPRLMKSMGGILFSGEEPTRRAACLPAGTRVAQEGSGYQYQPTAAPAKCGRAGI